MQFLGSSIYVTSSFYGFGSLLSTLDSLLLCFYHSAPVAFLQDGIFHKKSFKILDKLRMDTVPFDLI